MIGKVIKYNSQRGFGFIKGPDGKIFVHYTAIEGAKHALAAKEKVRFEVARGARGFQAVKVIPLNELD